jgi:signal transduction histidine kinase
MSNVIRFPATSPDGEVRNGVGHRPVEAAFLMDPAPHSHAVQFYDDETFLFETVSRFLGAGLRGGDRIVVIATEAHREGIRQQLESAGVKQAIETGQITFLDARETLSKFMVGGMPSPQLFRDLIARVLAKAKGNDESARVRAFGEMVDILWKEGDSTAAIRLEELWNDAGSEHGFSLLCAYTMGNFYKEGDQAKFFEVCRNHSHVIPTESFSLIDDPNARLREIGFLQQRARALQNEIQNRIELEAALRDALRERARIEEELRERVKREREARAEAEANDSFKEMFLGILGHDLRNPLNTVLTTARLMMMRRELPPESMKRLERVVSSGERMQRMIEQLLDLTSARLAGGIPVTRRQQDLVPLVSKIVDEIRVANPRWSIELCAERPCDAAVDSDRIEQVVSNLLGNAVKHGDPKRAIRVAVTARSGIATIVVHNYGAPIDPALVPLLFDPFKRGDKARTRSDGLGLGLFIAERIVAAHGGKIEVESTHDLGTRFEARFPQHD